MIDEKAKPVVVVKLLCGDKFWFQDGKLHREDGPAIEFAGGTKVWYLFGERVPESSVIEFQIYK